MLTKPRIVGIVVALAVGIAAVILLSDTNQMKLAAQFGNASSKYELAEAYQRGAKLPQDKALAAEWYLKAAEAGNRDAQYMIAEKLAKGDGVSRDKEGALKWLQRAADSGSPRAKYFLGEGYIYGNTGTLFLEVPRDPPKGIALLIAAAEAGDWEAQSKLGTEYGNGLFVKRDEEKSLDWYLTAAKNPKTNSSWAADQIPHQSYMVCSRNAAKCKDVIDWLRQSEDARAKYYLAIIYKEGLGVAKDVGEALRLLRLSAETSKNGFSNAHRQLGDMYLDGDGVRKDYWEAVKWLDEAAQRRDEEALTKIVNVFARDEVTPRNVVERYKWINIAVAKKYNNVEAIRRELERDMTPEQIHAAQSASRQWLEKY